MKTYCKSIIIVFLALLAGQSKAQTFQVDDIIIGNPNIHYLDPEFIDVNGQYKVMFTDSVYSFGYMRVADLDPVTGKFISSDGLDWKVDSNIAPIYQTLINGPEWAVDTGGLSLFYTKYDHNGKLQVWHAQLSNPPVLTQLTNDTSDCIHWAATLNPTDSNVKFFSVKNIPPYGYVLFWHNENNIYFSYTNSLPGYIWPGNNGPRFIPGTPYFVYSKQITANKIEIVRVNTLDNTVKVITNDSIKKVDCWGFKAPEFNNEICYSACTSDTTLDVYRFVNLNDPFATKIATIKTPPGEILKYISSVEILQTAEGLFDKTYFAFRGAKITEPLTPVDGAMWIASLGADSTGRFVRRVDIGAVTGDTAYRQEPELLVGKNELFLYYNSYEVGGIKQLRRCRTGIFKKTTSVIEQPNTIGKVLVYPNPTNPTLFIKIENNNLLQYQITNSLGQVLQQEKVKSNRIDVSSLQKGIYFIQLRDEKGELITRKFIKQ